MPLESSARFMFRNVRYVEEAVDSLRSVFAAAQLFFIGGIEINAYIAGVGPDKACYK